MTTVSFLVPTLAEKIPGTLSCDDHHNEAHNRINIKEFHWPFKCSVQKCNQADKKSHHHSSESLSLLFGQRTGDTGQQWIPHTKGQQCAKCLHLVLSSILTLQNHFMLYQTENIFLAPFQNFRHDYMFYWYSHIFQWSSYIFIGHGQSTGKFHRVCIIST